MDGFTGGGEALALTKLLQYISSIKADCMARQQANDAQLSTMVAEQESQTKRLKRMFQTRFKIPYQFLDTNPFVDSLVQSDYHLSSEVKHQNFSISEMRRLIKETQYTLLLYIQASHASDWTDNKGNKEEKQSVNNSRRRYIDGEHCRTENWRRKLWQRKMQVSLPTRLEMAKRPVKELRTQW
ncbi:unnamed protein product [Brassica oleracea var. botrytis]|uniref:(rape) hypothetical protein n=1 Tax=Brassica napus TaxID=3708 RepID=A0A078FF00_BRANA|nr:unnamed protein product [Brassica napus]CDY12970.1 BnaC02g29770D [Brassica napus]